MSDSWRPHGLQPTRLLHPWDFRGKSTGVGCLLSFTKLLIWEICIFLKSRKNNHREKVTRVDNLSWTRQKYGEGNGTALQYSCLENPMDGGAWWAAVHGVAKSRTRLSDFTFTFHFHALEKEMATHSSVLAWRIPGMGEPGGLPSLGSHRVGHG